MLEDKKRNKAGEASGQLAMKKTSGCGYWGPMVYKENSETIRFLFHF